MRKLPKKSGQHYRVKLCRFYYRIQTQLVPVPEQFQRDTRLPGNPRGDERTGFGLLRRELLTVAMLDRLAGGKPVIEKVPVGAASE
jgi:hypothetical protein